MVSLGIRLDPGEILLSRIICFFSLRQQTKHLICHYLEPIEHLWPKSSSAN